MFNSKTEVIDGINVATRYNGSLELTQVIGGYLETEVYYGYTVSEAVAKYKEKYGL